MEARAPAAAARRSPTGSSTTPNNDLTPHSLPVNAEFLHDRLPKSKLDIIDVGHFTWEDAADQYASLVTAWWSGGYATAGSVAAP